MCPKPGMMLRITATASLALPSAVSVALRFQSHRSQLCASFGRGCPQYGHVILPSAPGSERVAGASVYSTLISVLKTTGTEFVKQREYEVRRRSAHRTDSSAGETDRPWRTRGNA